MTIEELNHIKDAFSQIIEDIAGNPDWYEAARAVASDLGTLERELGKKVASLPTNLDEAAWKYADDSCFDDPEFTATMLAFKAGAEWMAGQGYTKEGIARPDDCEIWVNMTGTDINDGDKVVVQIRKK